MRLLSTEAPVMAPRWLRLFLVLQTWDVDFLETWIKQHAADAKAMGKPFMIEEFGKEVHLESGAQANISSIRGPFYRKVYQQLQESLNADGPLKGAQLCWSTDSE